jgi:SAM-dependent methyltransferase
MTTTDARPRQLISDRFRHSGKSAHLPHASQREAMQLFLDRMRSGRYKMVFDQCPCGATPEDVVIAEVDRYGLPLTSVLCLPCGTVRLDPYLDANSLDDFYRNIYQNLYGRSINPEEYFDRQRAYGRKVLATVAAGQKIAVLEVGCGAAGGLAVLAEAGHFVAGCDYSDRLIQFGTRKGVPNLHTGPIDEVSAKMGRDRFDLIYLHHVFEHVDRPVETLHSLAKLLAQTGRILLIVPELDGIRDAVNPGGDAIGMIHVAHKYNYTMPGLQAVATRAGLRGQRAIPPAGMPTPWSAAPELWVELGYATGAPEPNYTGRLPGRQLLRYLRRTDWLYRHGLCPPQLVARYQASSTRRLARRVARKLGLIGQ